MGKAVSVLQGKRGFRAFAVVLASLAVLTPSVAFPAESPQPLDSERSIVLSAEQLEAWGEQEEALTPETLLRAPPSSVRLSSFTYYLRPIWVRLRVTSQTPSLRKTLQLLPALFNEVTVYTFNARGERVGETHFRVGHAGEEGSLRYPNPALALTLDSGLNTLIVRIRAMDTGMATFRFDPPEAALSRLATQHAILAFYFGILLSVFLYNLVIFLSVRLRFLLYYMAFMLSMGALTACVNGYFDFWIAASSPLTHYLGIINYTCMITATLFVREFLKTSELMPRFERLCRVLLGLYAGGILISIPSIYPYFHSWSSPLLDSLTLAQTFSVWFAVGLACWRGFRPARYFLVAWTGSIVGIVVYLLFLYGAVPETLWTQYSLPIACAFEMLVLTFAVGDRLQLLQEERAFAAQKALEAERLSLLLGMASHDLASPLSVIQMQADLGSVGLPIDWSRIQTASEQQEKILTYIRGARNGPHPLRAIALSDVMKELEFLYRERATTKGISLELPCANTLRDIKIQGEAVVLAHSVLGNLINNAIKFSPSGQTVALRISAEGSEWTRFEVVDHGVGIPQKELALIENGVQGKEIHRAGTELESGSGMGLALVRGFTEALGGNLKIFSQSGKDGFAQTGTTAVLRIPQAG